MGNARQLLDRLFGADREDAGKQVDNLTAEQLQMLVRFADVYRSTYLGHATTNYGESGLYLALCRLRNSDGTDFNYFVWPMRVTSVPERAGGQKGGSSTRIRWYRTREDADLNPHGDVIYSFEDVVRFCERSEADDEYFSRYGSFEEVKSLARKRLSFT
jgi:hypothetical protein